MTLTEAEANELRSYVYNRISEAKIESITSIDRIFHWVPMEIRTHGVIQSLVFKRKSQLRFGSKMFEEQVNTRFDSWLRGDDLL